MAAKKKTTRRKKPRTAAQKRATAKLVALNKKRRAASKKTTRTRKRVVTARKNPVRKATGKYVIKVTKIPKSTRGTMKVMYYNGALGLDKKSQAATYAKGVANKLAIQINDMLAKREGIFAVTVEAA